MEIRLRQHKDGSYVLEVSNREIKKEFDITNIIREIFVTKLTDLETRVRLEEKYRNWVTEAAQKNSVLLSSARTRYSAVVRRLESTDHVIDGVVSAFSTGRGEELAIRQLNKEKEQNEEFISSDDTLEKLSQ